MKLIYKIEFNSTNLYFKYILQELINDFKIKAICKQYKGFILIDIDDEREIIGEFFKFLETELPISFFIGKSYIIEEYDNSLEEIKDYDILQNISLLTNRKIKEIIDSNNIDFLNDILKLSKGDISRIDTRNGTKDFFLANKNLREKFENKGFEIKLLVADISKLKEFFEISMKDFQLLCSIERPLVKLKFKLGKNLNNEFSSTKFIFVKLPDDKETVLFSEALKKNGMPLVLFVNDEVYQESLKVTYFKEDNIIIKGDRGIFPKFDFIANKKYNTSKEYFDDNDGVYKAILAQRAKRLVPTIGVYFSLDSKNSSISINLPIKGLKSIIFVPDINNCIETCLDEISNIDENTQRLIINYKKRFYKNCSQNDLAKHSKGFLSILNICSKLIGLKDAKELEDIALASNLKSGLQIDMKLIKKDGINYLDYRRIIQSIMSYKIADVDNVTLAYSFYESLSDFIGEIVSEVVKDIKVKDIVFCGNMFSNSILLEKTYKKLDKLYNIILPKEYPLDY